MTATSEQARLAWLLMQSGRFAMREALIRAEWLLELADSPEDEPFTAHRQRVLRYQARLARP